MEESCENKPHEYMYIYIYIYTYTELYTGQAGTIFYDSRLTDEMATGRVVRESLDRLSIIIMGGVAAEANKYGKTEGGLDDERQLIDFFQTQGQPGTIFFFLLSL